TGPRRPGGDYQAPSPPRPLGRTRAPPDPRPPLCQGAAMSEPKPEPCYREATNGVHFTRNTHRHDCAEADCRGCKPCPGRHCSARTNCTWHVDAADLTCGRCGGEARRELRWIGDLAALMMTQAMSDGVESESAYLAGPAADPEA